MGAANGLTNLLDSVAGCQLTGGERRVAADDRPAIANDCFGGESPLTDQGARQPIFRWAGKLTNLSDSAGVTLLSGGDLAALGYHRLLTNDCFAIQSGDESPRTIDRLLANDCFGGESPPTGGVE